MRIDVVIPCYNYARFLPQCVESVLAQQGVAVRALVIDDCSSDNTQEVGREIAGRDSRVEFRRHGSNQGHIATYNEGLLEWAAGDGCLLISADDVLAPGALARAARALTDNPDVGLCYGREIVFCDEVPVHVASDADAGYERMSGHDLIAIACNAGDNPVPTPTAVVRTTSQKRVGGYRRELPHTADLEMWLRLGLDGAVCCVEAVQAYKRDHSSNMIKQFVPTILPDLRQRKLAFEMALASGTAQIADARELLGLALRRLAGQAFWGAHTAFERGDLHLVSDLLALAQSMDPGWPGSPEWRRFGWKRRLGPRGWLMVEPLLKLVRRA